MKYVYTVERTPHGVRCRVAPQTDPGAAYELRHVVFHSPTGFEFGYGGSGPADLALSILAHHFDEDPTEQPPRPQGYCCLDYYQTFKWDVIARMVHPGGAITTGEIETFLAREDERREEAANA